MHHTIDGLIDRQLRRWEVERSIAAVAGRASASPPVLHPPITVSRQHGSGGAALAGQLAEAFHYTLLHRDVIDRMCASTGIAHRLFEVLDERVRSQVDTWCESMLGGHYVDSGDYSRTLLRIIRSIAELGGVVVVGRGANFILGPANGFHVRVVAPRAERVLRVMERKGISERAAAHEVEHCDHERSEFMRRVFGRSADDPLAYDVIVNLGETTAEAAVPWLAAAARDKLARVRAAHAAAGTGAGAAH